uniref:Uncharacterized protein n=1 Tax=Timema bartmani TaxID=61472 RepID=A0A7R9I3U4_9NEOP|nr:unnamed protein product [Timema bartmani]
MQYMCLGHKGLNTGLLEGTQGVLTVHGLGVVNCKALQFSVSSERFSVGMAILNLVVRPVTSLVLYRIYSDRSDSLGNGFGGILGGSVPRRKYLQARKSAHKLLGSTSHWLFSAGKFTALTPLHSPHLLLFSTADW